MSVPRVRCEAKGHRDVSVSVIRVWVKCLVFINQHNTSGLLGFINADYKEYADLICGICVISLICVGFVGFCNRLSIERNRLVCQGKKRRNIL